MVIIPLASPASAARAVTLPAGMTTAQPSAKAETAVTAAVATAVASAALAVPAVTAPTPESAWAVTAVTAVTAVRASAPRPLPVALGALGATERRPAVTAATVVLAAAAPR